MSSAGPSYFYPGSHDAPDPRYHPPGSSSGSNPYQSSTNTPYSSHLTSTGGSQSSEYRPVPSYQGFSNPVGQGIPISVADLQRRGYEVAQPAGPGGYSHQPNPGLNPHGPYSSCQQYDFSKNSFGGGHPNTFASLTLQGVNSPGHPLFEMHEVLELLESYKGKATKGSDSRYGHNVDGEWQPWAKTFKVKFGWEPSPGRMYAFSKVTEMDPNWISRGYARWLDEAKERRSRIENQN